MRIEAFTEGKNPADPNANEDALLILPGRAYAVMDGVTDRIGTRYDGVLAGRYASQLLQVKLEQILGPREAPLDDLSAVVTALSAAMRSTYDRLGTTEQVRGDWNRQMASTLALVTLAGEWAHLVLVGDSGVRLNGKTVIRNEKDLDRITSNLRTNAWAPICARTNDALAQERFSRQVAWSGTRHAAGLVGGILTAKDLEIIERQTMDFCRDQLPHVPQPEAARMVHGGIVNGQGGYQNNPASVLGYCSLNGFDIPPDMLRIHRFPRAELHSIELFSDGYFAPGPSFGIAAWEAMFAEVERIDPHKVGAYPSPKGSAGGFWTDDRAYLGVEF